MDNLLEKLTDVEITSHPNNPHSVHPHYSLYKSKSLKISQDERRQMTLEARKEARYDLLSHLRNFEDNSHEASENEEEEETGMAVDEVHKCYRKPKRYRNFVMLSEWLVDVPKNFEQDYIAVLCPVGKRCLCICSRGQTYIYAKNGKKMKQFLSLLPGGSRRSSKRGYTVLDCIWSEPLKTMFVLDLVFWSRYSYIDCDTVFRFSWLSSCIHELDDDVSEKTSNNHYKFKPLPHFDCSKSSLKSMFEHRILKEVSLDGILFYHKESHYTHGPSPLVCWLKAFMLPEILGVDVPTDYMQDRPSHYQNITSHIEEYNEKRQQLKNRHSTTKMNKEKMDVSPCPKDANEEH